MSEAREYLWFSASQELELGLACCARPFGGGDLPRARDLADALAALARAAARGRCRSAWRAEQRSQQVELRKRIAELERALGRKTYELEIAGKLLPDGE